MKTHARVWLDNGQCKIREFDIPRRKCLDAIAAEFGNCVRRIALTHEDGSHSDATAEYGEVSGYLKKPIPSCEG